MRPPLHSSLFDKFFNEKFGQSLGSFNSVQYFELSRVFLQNAGRKIIFKQSYISIIIRRRKTKQKRLNVFKRKFQRVTKAF